MQVCNDGFPAASVAAVCLHLGLGTRGQAYTVPSVNETLPVLVERFDCAGASSLANCSYDADHNCDHREDVGLTCETGEAAGRWGTEGI